jgi:hypothetical protein
MSKRSWLANSVGRVLGNCVSHSPDVNSVTRDLGRLVEPRSVAAVMFSRRSVKRDRIHQNCAPMQKRCRAQAHAPARLRRGRGVGVRSLQPPQFDCPAPRTQRLTRGASVAAAFPPRMALDDGDIFARNALVG